MHAYSSSYLLCVCVCVRVHVRVRVCVCVCFKRESDLSVSKKLCFSNNSLSSHTKPSPNSHYFN